ncbi:hypothetical protein DAPPUDRAFT_250999 [Daphnia pulex]|uniref:Uncharacterized protein n=1 Tax=Daphnia pulex TaxID=6669 RepID=E9GZK4_DAPPU|nr:hypothetical protein DAPPUDRAFT_250999 [Daphnia pulex]|eukprot:EFX75010.1 hypothetical protein DAPPUDRAFT_250999 [Daphnia pulex]
MNVSTSTLDGDQNRGMQEFHDQKRDVHIFPGGLTFNLTCYNSDAFGHQVEWLGPHRAEEDAYYYREKETPPRFR